MEALLSDLCYTSMHTVEATNVVEAGAIRLVPVALSSVRMTS